MIVSRVAVTLGVSALLAACGGSGGGGAAGGTGGSSAGAGGLGGWGASAGSGGTGGSGLSGGASGAGGSGTCPDADGDGHTAASCGGDDCNDADPNVHPGAAERWATETIDQAPTFSGLYNDLFVDPDGTAHTVYQQDTGIRYATRTASGWTTEDVGPNGTVVSMAQGNGVIHVAYRGTMIRHAKRDAGVWSVEDVMAAPAGLFYGLAIGVAPDGSVRIASIPEQSASSPKLIVSSNQSGSWVSTQIGPASQISSSGLFVDNAGHTQVYFGASGGDLVHASDDTGSWALETVGTLASDPTLSRASDGSIHLAYGAWVTSQTSDVYYATNQSGSWNATKVKAYTPVPGDAPRPDIAIDSSGVAQIALMEPGTQRLVYCRNDAQSFACHAITDGKVEEGSISIAVDAQNAPYIVYSTNLSSSFVYATPDAVDDDCDGSLLL